MGIYIVLAGAMANIIGTWTYFAGTIRGTTKPNRVSWLFWTLSTFIAAFGGLAADVGWAVVPVFVSATLCLLIFIASFVNPHAYWKLGFFDYICGFFASIALVLWAVTGEPTVAIAFAIVGDLFASLPTVAKAWEHPQTESAGTYVGGLCNGVSALLVVQTFNFASIAFPISLIVQEVVILFALCRRKLVP